jgi:hypothetical protein
MTEEDKVMNLFEARKLARECMYDDQAEAVETLVRAILKDPEDPGLPTVEPPVERVEPQTGVHAQGTTEASEVGPNPDDPRLHRDFGVTPSLLETMEVAEATLIPEPSDYERGWRAGRGAAVQTLQELVRHSARQSPEEAAYVSALNCVNDLEVKGEP